jgi:hypothetical protein
MGMFDRKSQVVESAGWTGMESAVLERQHAPIKSAKLQPMPTEAKQDDYLAEYAELAKIVGIMPPDLGIEAFKAFLLAKDIPVFSLSEVTKYMDEKAAKESKDQAARITC